MKTVVLSFCIFICAFAKAYAEKPTNAPPLLDPCAFLTAPLDGETNVAVDVTITWQPIAGAAGYQINLGTTPGASDIVSNGTANGTSFTPPLGLPETSTIYVRIAPISMEGQVGEACDEQSFTTEDVTTVPQCTTILSPFDMEMDVVLNPTIQWSYAARATSYRVIVIRTGDNTTIADQNVGNTLSFFVPTTLDPQTEYSVQVIPLNENGEAVGCTIITFTTGGSLAPPGCTQLTTPANGAVDVALSPFLQWPPVPDADGYRISVGTTPGGVDILDNADLGDQTSTLVLEFDEGIQVFVTITPYNTAGDAVGCPITNFFTTRGCGPYVDDLTGEIVDLRPVIVLQDTYLLCLDQGSLDLFYDGEADEFIWSTFTPEGVIDEGISTARTISITTPGIYQLEVIKETDIGTVVLDCKNTHVFEVITSEAATIETVDITNAGLGSQLTVSVSGAGDYEYAINDNTQYQDDPTFQNIAGGNITVFVRDKNGCGEVSQTVRRELGFPKYFTPNGDGVNDRWQVRGRIVDQEIITEIDIYDRYGKLITRIDSRGPGWDGVYNGDLLFDGGYWYKANTQSGAVFTGFFALRL